MGKVQPFKSIGRVFKAAGTLATGGLLGGKNKEAEAADRARLAAEQNLATEKANQEARFKDEQLRLQAASNEEIGKRSTALSAFLARQKNDPNFGGNKFGARGGKRISIFDNV